MAFEVVACKSGRSEDCQLFVRKDEQQVCPACQAAVQESIEDWCAEMEHQLKISLTTQNKDRDGSLSLL